MCHRYTDELAMLVEKVLLLCESYWTEYSVFFTVAVVSTYSYHFSFKDLRMGKGKLRRLVGIKVTNRRTVEV